MSAIDKSQVHRIINVLIQNTPNPDSDEKPPIYNVWNFADCDPRFGQAHPGQIPGQVVLNLLLWLTKPFDFVVDPMGGGGTAIDVCKYLNRRYKVFDIDPRRPDIEEWDIRKGYPKLPRKPDFIFLDPPYWRLKQSEYSADGSAMGSYADWLAFMTKLAKDSARTVRPGCHVALMVESFLDEKESGEFLFLNRDCLNLFEKAGLEGIQEISVNMPSQIKSFRDVLYAREHNILLDLKRELFVFRRPSL
ncbi:MAG TPA: DNA methyltransferase [Dehalococcoidia bacterium]|nr:DNA methyltransferase [Dehalococcoidia bacterium]